MDEPYSRKVKVALMRRSVWPARTARGQGRGVPASGVMWRPTSAPARKKGMRGEEALGQASSTVAHVWEVPLQGGGERKNAVVAVASSADWIR